MYNIYEIATNSHIFVAPGPLLYALHNVRVSYVADVLENGNQQ